jgi:hypothetical protein
MRYIGIRSLPDEAIWRFPFINCAEIDYEEKVGEIGPNSTPVGALMCRLKKLGI